MLTCPVVEVCWMECANLASGIAHSHELEDLEQAIFEFQLPSIVTDVLACITWSILRAQNYQVFQHFLTPTAQIIKRVQYIIPSSALSLSIFFGILN